MGVKGVDFQLQHRDCDVRAVVADPLQTGQQVVQNKTLPDRAAALLKALHMVELDLIAELINQLLQRLNTAGQVQIIFHKGANRKAGNLAGRAAKDLQLMLRFVGKADVLLMNLGSAFCDIQGKVRNPLKIAQRMQILGQIVILFPIQLLTGDADQIRAQTVLIVIAVILFLFDVRETFLGVMLEQLAGGEQRVLRAPYR